MTATGERRVPMEWALESCMNGLLGDTNTPSTVKYEKMSAGEPDEENANNPTSISCY